MAWINSLWCRRLMISCHMGLLACTYYLAFLLRFDFMIRREHYLLFLQTLPLVLLIKIPVCSAMGLLRGWWRYASTTDLLDIVKASTLSSMVLGILVLFLRPSGYPRSVLLIDLLLTIFVLGGMRLSVRVYQETAGRHVARKNTLVVGAGVAGSQMVRQLKLNPQLDLNPIGYVDDDPSKQGIKIQGVRILGKIADLARVAQENCVACVLIAMPSADAALLRSIVEKCERCRVELRILPKIRERIDGTNSLSKLRQVRMEDLLGRPPVSLDLTNIREKLNGKTVMVTGAGGSIGSELSRQLASFHPRRLILFERSENELHRIEVELHGLYPDLDYVPVVGDILDVSALRDVMAEHRPQSIFHAAAYKHVPMMEKNCFQAIVNNVFGTYNVALVARQYGVGDFLMISSDKAVNPTNIMGVTKRIAELVILGLQHQHTRFVSVRFGNVLGSNGSVLPLFEQQLARGGPLTVTHPEVRRYFMTIPEAVQLVLQASTMGKGGEIFVLDMGAPVKIVDLAKNLIQLSGLRPGQDIQIVFTGPRPGEKLFEELKLDGEGIKPTPHEKIRVLDGGSVNFLQVTRWLEDLSAMVELKNVNGLVRKLQEIVPEYSPSPEILSLCDLDCHDVHLGYQRSRAELYRTSMVEVPPEFTSQSAA